MSSIGMKNVFEKLETSDREIIETLLENNNIRIERIISNGDKSPEGFWYDQEEYEFVLLIEGEAELNFKEDGIVNLKKGDWLIIEPHKLHRVEKTSNDAIWLCIFYR